MAFCKTPASVTGSRQNKVSWELSEPAAVRLQSFWDLWFEYSHAYHQNVDTADLIISSSPIRALILRQRSVEFKHYTSFHVSQVLDLIGQTFCEKLEFS